jgi:sec-independent protein translocase protein TatA
MKPGESICFTTLMSATSLESIKRSQTMNFLLIGMPSGWEWVIILVAILLLFGGAKLPQLAKALGQSKKAFKEGLDEGIREDPKTEKEA